MPADRAFIERQLRRIIDEEGKAIIRKLLEVESTCGHDVGSSLRSIVERHRVIEEEVPCAADRIMNEIRELAGQDAPNYAEEGAAAVADLAQCLLDFKLQAKACSKQ
jgi:hypothetical protein